MDAFFASVEQRDNPELKGKPIAVGGSKERGVVAAASYEARKYGVRSAMPSKQAYERCPHIIFVPPNFQRYKEVSNQVMAIFREFTDVIEPMSLDEAYLDVTENKKGIPSATLIAKEIRARIFEETQLTASAGISFNKFIAKLASDINKPDGITLVTEKEAEAFLDSLPIKKFHGIGKSMEARMKEVGINTGSDLRQWSEVDLVRKFGKSGRFFYNVIRGKDNRPVSADRIRKSLGAERTFMEDLKEEADQLLKLEEITEEVIKRMGKSNVYGKTVTLKYKYLDFEQHTRSKTVDYWVKDQDKLWELVNHLFYEPEPPSRPVRLLGVTISTLNTEEENNTGQLSLEI